MIAITSLFEFDIESARSKFWKRQEAYANEKQIAGSVSEKEQKKILKNIQLEADRKYPK